VSIFGRQAVHGLKNTISTESYVARPSSPETTYMVSDHKTFLIEEFTSHVRYGHNILQILKTYKTKKLLILRHSVKTVKIPTLLHPQTLYRNGGRTNNLFQHGCDANAWIAAALKGATTLL
jgi:hypothetical protein